MIYIYSPARPQSSGARALASAIQELGGEARVTRRNPMNTTERDLVVGWGHPIGTRGLATYLNSASPGSKLTQFRTLRDAGIPVPQFTTTQPGADDESPWLARALHHTGGADLLNPPRRPDFWVRFMSFTREFRVHSWKLPGGEFVSARVGLKVPAEGLAPHLVHPWIRSYDGGWRLSYGARAQAVISQAVRSAAHAAVGALGLEFGAVDIGVRVDGSPVVLEVNRAPGMEGTTPQIYARKVLQWASA